MENQGLITKGFKTSEFWVGLAALLVPVLNGIFGWHLDLASILAVAGVASSYIWGRSKVKSPSSLGDVHKIYPTVEKQ